MLGIGFVIALDVIEIVEIIHHQAIGLSQRPLRGIGEPIEPLVRAIAAALRFDAPSDPGSSRLQKLVRHMGPKGILTDLSELEPDDPVADEIVRAWRG